MIFVLTSSEDQTADYLCHRLAEEGLRTIRLDTDLDVDAIKPRYTISNPVLQIRDYVISPDDVSHVWYRRPKPLVIGWDSLSKAEHLHTQAELTEAIEGFLAHVPESKWVNHPARNAIASHKLGQLSRAAKHGLNVPLTLMTQDAEEAKEFYFRNQGHVVVKPLSSGYLERDDGDDTLIYTNDVREEDLQHLSRVSKCPTFFQQRVCKKTDVRICLVDSEMIAVSLSKTAGHRQVLDIRRDNMSGVCYELIDVPSVVAEGLNGLMEDYKLRFAAIDMAVTESGDWTFFEINPNGQWAWLDIVGGTNVASLFLRSFGTGASS